MTHDELNRLVALKVDGWKIGEQAPDHSSVYWKDGQWVYPCDIPQYCTDPAAVIALLEKYDWIAGNHLLDGDYFCEINYPESRIIERAPTFALAATLALLKAHGCEVGE